ncbi:MAG: pseudaminic acid synthase, partial [Alphaproteobacteria bacterium]|nr:pseudaminic acid synthase [Alphaproteobacteria bacterium]
MQINDRKIGLAHRPYVIAELSANHNGKIENALKLIDEAHRNGADAIKLQTYRPDTITLKSDAPEFIHDGGLWADRTLYELYEEAHMPWEWHRPLFDHARGIGLTIFSSPFDHSAIDLLEDLDCPAYKIASFEAIDYELIKYAASTGKPMIISTGMCTLEEMKAAKDTALDHGAESVALLHCVSAYPAQAEDSHLGTIRDMRERFDCEIGLSDHTLDNTAAITSIALGASIIEKHFTLDRNGGGPDDTFSMEPRHLAALTEDAHNAWQALNVIDYDNRTIDQGNKQFRRSLYFINALKAGDTITKDDVKSVRPGYGLPPKEFQNIIG